MKQWLGSLLVVSGLTFGLGALGCGPSGPGTVPDGGTPGVDEDDDGFGVPADCNDADPAIHPEAADQCNGKDDNCDGKVDEAFDADGDGRATCAGDCDDADPTVFMGAPEIADGKDNDCDGAVDNHTAESDDDGDGWSEVQGDCNDGEKFVNPGAVEVQTKMDGTAEGVDNDCDGAVDEANEPCDASVNKSDPFTWAKAMEICNNVAVAQFNSGASADARNVLPSFGSGYTPIAGQHMGVLSSGPAVAGGNKQPGTGYYNMGSHPDPQPDPADGCGQADPFSVYDNVELTFEIDVPSNANSFSFDFNFMSAEFSEYVCTSYDDTFVAFLESGAYNGNISFDSMGKPVSINIAYFTVCDGYTGCTGSGPLSGTGFEGSVGGGTGWLTTTAPVVPGERVKLRFVIFDEGDTIYDSTVLLDNFRWHAEAIDNPITVERRAPAK